MTTVTSVPSGSLKCKRLPHTSSSDSLIASDLNFSKRFFETATANPRNPSSSGGLCDSGLALFRRCCKVTLPVRIRAWAFINMKTTNLKFERRVLPLPEPLPVSHRVEVAGIGHLCGLLLAHRRQKVELKAEVCNLNFLSHEIINADRLYDSD